jgi:hypothetical protein
MARKAPMKRFLALYPSTPHEVQVHPRSEQTISVTFMQWFAEAISHTLK